jgi:hypothetical protein
MLSLCMSQHLNQATDFHKIWSGQYAIRGHLNPILLNVITLDNKITNVPNVQMLTYTNFFSEQFLYQ